MLTTISLGLRHYTLVGGSGEGATRLNAFDAALLDAGVGNTNLIKLSSILPPGLEYRRREELEATVCRRLR